MVKAKNPFETYVNSLIFDNKVFMPSYGRPEDKQAQSIYESFGFEVIPLDSKNLSNYGHGSIHCITMLYPKMTLKSLADIFSAKIIN